MNVEIWTEAVQFLFWWDCYSIDKKELRLTQH
jgi:hypothetical protein